MKKKLMMLMAMAAGAMLYADTEIVDGVTWSYTKSGGNATVTGATPCAGEMVMPSTLGGCSVTAVGPNAFYQKYEITQMALPSTVNLIGNAAFDACLALTTITIPNGVTTIGASAFSGCTSLAKVELPDTVTSIGGCVFMIAEISKQFGCRLSCRQFPIKLLTDVVN